MPHSRPVATPGGAHVLVVDDDVYIREMLEVILRDAGYVVTSVQDGQAALDVLRDTRDRFVVLVDLVMPRMDGIALLNHVAGDRRLRSRHAYVLMSAQPRTLCSALCDLLASLSIPVLLKPFGMNALLNTVGELAGRTRWLAVPGARSR